MPTFAQNVLPRFGFPGQAVDGPVITITAARSLKVTENGATIIFNSASSLIATLPPVRKGLRFTFFVKQVPGSGVGPLIKTKGSAEKIYSKVSPTGATITEAAGKGIVNTQGTSVKGDGAVLVCDGTDWFAEPIGTWAREA